jgi:DNA (cytosine-5)-methyltransferase 1
VSLTIGSLFSGYGGLDLAIDGRVEWYSEIEPAACRVLKAHHGETPNIGDVTQYGECGCAEVIPWDHLPRVDVITAGYPCQPFSQAGKRKGKDDERHLWPYVRDAIRVLQPAVAVLENVRGHVSMGLDIVLGDLADMGWDARWGVVRASDAGAPHHRARIFIVAYPDSASSETRQHAGHDSSRIRVEPMGLTAPNARWGKYQQAVERWEPIVGRRAPAPTMGDRNGRPQLNPVLVEWMMGLDEGWVTGHGLTRSQELKMLGNGVVPQQARLALSLLGGPV